MSRRTLGIAAIAILFVLALLGGALHVRPVRAAIASWVERSLEATYPVDVQIGPLDYNLLRLDVRLLDVVLAAPDLPGTPFFRAPRSS